MQDDPADSAPLGFFGQLRDQHWAVKIILVFVVLMLASPFIALVGAVAYGVAREGGVWVYLGLVAFGAGWFIFTRPAQRVSPPTPAMPTPAAPAAGLPTASPGTSRYCESCGAAFAPGLDRCPECHEPWRDVPADSIGSMAAYLNRLTRDRLFGLLDETSFRRLRAEYERHLRALRPLPPPAPAPAAVPFPGTAPHAAPPPPEPARPAAAIQAPSAVPAARPAPARPAPRAPAPPPKPVEPRPSAADMGRAVIGWAAERQADILLYVGAFLLSVAAIIFVAYQGEELSGTIRFSVLTAYAVGFLAFGLLLHRWERVKEAGPAFLALGAILVPLDFVALRTQVLSHDQIANDVLWLIASSSCAALYFVLAFRGYGRFYFLPAIPATLTAWGSLGSVLNLPIEWFGPWYGGIAAPAYVAATALLGRWSPAKWMLGLAVAIGAASLAWTHVVAAAGGDHHAAVPVAYGLATAAVASGLRWRRDILPLAALPPLAATTGATAWWATFGLGYEWQPVFVALAGGGYLVVAHFQPEGRARGWAAVAAAFGTFALLAAHTAMADTAAARAALPATYGVVFAATAGAFGRWGWAAAAAALPPLGGMTLATAAWASGEVGTEWYGAFAVVAAFGYLGLAAFDRPERTGRWQVAAALTAAIGPPLAHVTVVLGDDPQRWSLPVTYGLVLLGTVASFLRWRWDWRLAPGVLPVSAAATALTAAWAQWDLQVEWYPAFAAAAGLGYLALAHFDEPRLARSWGAIAAVFAMLALAGAHVSVLESGAERAALPLSYGLVLGGAAAAIAHWRWTEASAILPPVAAMTGLTSGWAWWDLQVEWYPAFAAAAGLGYLVVAHFDHQGRARAWGAAALAFAGLAIAGVHVAVLELGAERTALPLAYGLVLVGVVAAYARWRWAGAAALLPPVAAMTGLTAAWAQWDLQREWYASFAAAADLGYLVLARFDLPGRRRYWWSGAMLAAGLAVPMAHVTVAERPGAEHLALPLAYAILTVGAGAAFAVWQYAWRVAPGALPSLAAMTAITVGWAAWEVQPAWYGAIATTATFGYIAVALTDAKAWARPWLVFAAVAGGAGVVFTQVAQFVEVEPAPAHAALPVAYGQVAVAAAFAAGWWRWACREAVALVPPLAAAFGASLLWATVEMRPDWLTVWAAAAVAGYLVPALLDRRYRGQWQSAAVFLGMGVLLVAHGLATVDAPVRWQLPASYAVLLAAWAALAARLRDGSALAPPVLASAFGATALWAAEVEPQWWPYPALGVAAVIAAAAPWWRANRVFGRVGWGYSVSLATVAAIAVLPVDYTHHGHGAAVQLAAAALVFVASLGARGTIFGLFVENPTARARTAEWSVLSQAAFAFLFGAGASLNGLLEIDGAGRAWVFATLSLAGWALVASRWRMPQGLWTFAPVGLAGVSIASLIAAEAQEAGYGVLTGVLAIATFGPLVGYAGARRWTLLGIANSFLFLAIWSGWRWQDLDTTYLPLAFAGVATLEWTALVALRRYTREPSEPNVVINYLSWAPWLLSATVSGILLSREQARLEPGASLVSTEEWSLAATVLGLLSAAVTAEGIRLKRRQVWIAGSAGLLGALLMAIATRQPDNIQAYTAPIGIYLIAVALTFRRSPPFIRDHMHVHEAVMVIGALHLVFPPAEQSFEPGGGKFGLELIGIGLGLLAAGLLLHGRWLVAAAILTLSATSARMVTGGLFTTPYWLLLGIAGTALIGFGLLVLLERERWDRFRHTVVRWWSSVEEAPVEPLGEPRSPQGQHS
jgi:hypothetical protein